MTTVILHPDQGCTLRLTLMFVCGNTNGANKLQRLYGLWEGGDPNGKRSIPRDDYKDRFKRDPLSTSFPGI
ncbi:hypothetical protein DY000_02055492 [Brassica cretica]|uniref:Uncharacterized protein n=1 Tax=Brassica cretica TaxID=69181 RepID=A0ABQ7A5J9_BRACR|nr:hypothetical protein DY000_02055492 [Brassica cretica]